jgi:hypothetical protein
MAWQRIEDMDRPEQNSHGGDRGEGHRHYATDASAGRRGAPCATPVGPSRAFSTLKKQLKEERRENRELRGKLVQAEADIEALKMTLGHVLQGLKHAEGSK